MNKEHLINEQGLASVEFITNFTGDNFEDSLVLRTNDVFNIELIDANTYKNIVNLNKINDINGINKFLSTVNSKLSENCIFIRAFGNLECNSWKQIVKKYSLDKECKLLHDTLLNKYYFIVVFEGKDIIINERREVVALDPGEKIFNYFYSNELEGKLGDVMRIKII